MLVLYTFALPVLLGVVALALDGGKLFVSRIHLQNAADAAALASSQDLGSCVDFSNPPTYQSAGCDVATVGGVVAVDVSKYSNYNGGPTGLSQCAGYWYDESQSQRNNDSNCYTWPYKKRASDSPRYDQVEVRLRKPLNLDFAGIVGFNNPSHPWARAVATYKAQTTTTTVPGVTTVLTIPGTTYTTTTPETTYTTTTPDTTTTIVTPGTTYTTTTVIPGATHTTTNLTGGNGQGGVAFAKSTACPAISWTGAATGTLGAFTTNGGFFSNGNSNKSMTYLAVGRRNDPGCFQNLAPVAIGQTVGPFSPQDWPLPMPTVPTAPAGCTLLTAAPGTTTIGFKPDAAHPPGVYCVTDPSVLLSFGNVDLTGGKGYTFFATSIAVSGGKYKNYSGLPAGQPPTVFYASQNITIQANGSMITGDIFAPNGEISIQGSGVQGGSGFLESQTLKIAGTFANYSGTGGVGGTTTVVITTDPATTTTIVTTGPGSTTVTTIPGGSTLTTSPGGTTVVTSTGSTITGTSPPSTVTSTGSTTIGLGE